MVLAAARAWRTSPQNPPVLVALSPHYALQLHARRSRGWPSSRSGAVVLCVTGAEALYADMGHFGKRPIRLAWFGLVMPALVLNYFGQGAMLLAHPEHGRATRSTRWRRTGRCCPLIGLATLATVIASQALITAAFSVTKQAIQLGYLPRLRILHTSVRDTGQIYVPFVNWGLYVCIVLAVVLFGSSSKLAAAYGIAVTIDMLITTMMTFFVIRYGWKLPAGAVHRRDRLLLRRRLRLLRGQRRQGPRRRLVPAADRRGDVHADDDLEAGPPADEPSACATRRST